jgi:SAM-dependent methyltransferase
LEDPLVELITEGKIRSYECLKIRCEFYDLWNKLFLNKNLIDRVVFKNYGELWPLGKLISLARFKYLWFIPRLRGVILNSEIILRSNQLWMTRAWEYPWAILNSEISSNTRVLDVGSGWSLFPPYLAQKSKYVDSIDADERQMKILSPALANILKLRVNYFVDNALDLSAKDDTYDYVFCISVLEHLEEEVERGKPVNKHTNKLDKTAIREFLRVIKPGGRVILTLDYASEDVSERSFHFDYVKDLIEEFRANLLKPFDDFDSIRFTKEKENEMRKLWVEFFPYEPENPPGGAIGIILTKR